MLQNDAKPQKVRRTRTARTSDGTGEAASVCGRAHTAYRAQAGSTRTKWGTTSCSHTNLRKRNTRAEFFGGVNRSFTPPPCTIIPVAFGEGRVGFSEVPALLPFYAGSHEMATFTVLHRFSGGHFYHVTEFFKFSTLLRGAPFQCITRPAPPRPARWLPPALLRHAPS